MKPATAPPPPYPFQIRALAELERVYDAGFVAPVLVSPTGSGKTVMAAYAMQDKRFASVVAVSDRLALVEQNEQRLCPTFTPQSLLNGIPKGFGKPDLVIWDECHKSQGAQFKTVQRRFPQAWMLGLTATPQRADGQALELFDTMVVAAHYSELLLHKTIVPCEVVVPLGFYEDQTPDLHDAYLDNRELGDRAIIFCRSVDEADDVARRTRRTQAYHSLKPQKWNKQVLAALRSGTLDAVTTVDALSEGIDVPRVNLIVLGQPCVNVLTYLQRCGRGLRATEGKRYAKVVDCVGASLRHGSPIEDRIYSIDGVGIQRRGGGGQSWEYDRDPGERAPASPYKAKWKTLYGWKNPSEDDKRRQLGWLRQHAARNGYQDDLAEQCFTALFGESPPEAPKSRKVQAAE